jgi:hypothetical protein
MAGYGIFLAGIGMKSLVRIAVAFFCCGLTALGFLLIAVGSERASKAFLEFSAKDLANVRIIELLALICCFAVVGLLYRIWRAEDRDPE